MIVSILLVFMNFMIFFLFFSGWRFSCILSMYLGALFGFLMKFIFLKKIRKALQPNKVSVTDILGPCFLGLGRLNEYET